MNGGMTVLDRLIMWIRECGSSGFRWILRLFVLHSVLGERFGFGLRSCFTSASFYPALLSALGVYTSIAQSLHLFSYEAAPVSFVSGVFHFCCISSTLTWDKKFMIWCFPLCCVLHGLQVVLAVSRGLQKKKNNQPNKQKHDVSVQMESSGSEGVWNTFLEINIPE